MRVKAIPFGPFCVLPCPTDIKLTDMVKLGEAFMRLLDGRSRAVSPMLAPEPVAHMIHQVVFAADTEGVGAPEQFPCSFGLGAADYGGPLYGHNGSRAVKTCAVRFDPKHRIAIAVGLNAGSRLFATG